MATQEQRQRVEQADALYERFGRPLDARHRGEYVAIASDGRTLLGTSVVDVLERTASAFGPGSFIFKVGEESVGKWR